MTPVAVEFRCVAPDFPGFGESQLMADANGWREMVDWLDRFVNEMKLAPLHLAVHDWGGLIGLPWMCENPDKVHSLLITNTSFRATDRWHGFARQLRDEGSGEEMMENLNPEGFKALVQAFSSHVLDETLAEFYKCVETPELRAAKLELYRSLEFSMFEPYMEKFKEVARGKTRIIWGGEDQLLPQKIAQEFAKRTAGHATILDAGHFLQEDRGEEVGRLHTRFLETRA